MTTNLIATITVLLSTNAVTHWPQKFFGTVPNPGYAAWAAIAKIPFALARWIAKVYKPVDTLND